MGFSDKIRTRPKRRQKTWRSATTNETSPTETLRKHNRFNHCDHLDASRYPQHPSRHLIPTSKPPSAFFHPLQAKPLLPSHLTILTSSPTVPSVTSLAGPSRGKWTQSNAVPFQIMSATYRATPSYHTGYHGTFSSPHLHSQWD